MKIALTIFSFLILGCNVIQTIGGGKTRHNFDWYTGDDTADGGETLYLNLSFPQAKRDFYISDETSVRTVSISAPSTAAVSCSEDNGVTWVSCGTSYIWNAANYNATHVVSAELNGEIIERSFVPSNQVSGISFGACDQTISADMSIASFNTLSPASGEVVCIDNGVIISNSGTDGPATVSVGSVKFYVREGGSATIRNDTEAAATFSANVAADFYGINVINSQAGHAMSFGNGGPILWDCELHSQYTATAYAALNLSNASATIHNSILTHDGISNGYGMYINNGNATLYGTTIYGGYQAIYFFKNDTAGYTISLNDSHLYGQKSNATATAPGVIGTFVNNATNQLSIDANNTVLTSDGGPAIHIKDAAGIVATSFNGARIERTGIVNNSGPAVYVADTTGINSFTADATSLVCNHTSSSGALFNSIFSDSGGNATFDVTTMDAHSSNTDIGLCP